MKNPPSYRRLAENEMQFRALNEKTHGGLTTVNDLAREHQQPEFMVGEDTPLYFYCECSNPDCTMRIRMTYREYGKIHRDRQDFIVVPRHETDAIETVVARHSGYNVVRKTMQVLKKAKG